MTNTPTTWPKPFLLEIYRRAVSEGCVRIPLESAAQAKSLVMSFYRLRRRSDAQHAAFIRPEFHLVTCAWESQRGTLLVTYNSLPDGSSLPEILSVDKQSLSAPAPELANPPIPFIDNNLRVPNDPDEIFDADDFVQGLVDEAAKRGLSNEPD